MARVCSLAWELLYAAGAAKTRSYKKSLHTLWAGLGTTSSRGGSVETNLTSMHEEDAGSIPGLAPLVKDLELLRLWCRPARPLAKEPPYATGVAPWVRILT